MAGISDIAESLLISSQRRIDLTSVNVSNINTPGFRSQRAFQRIVDARQALPAVLTSQMRGVEAGALKSTGNPLDIAMTGGGSMLVRSGERLVPVVSGQFHRDADGRLVDGGGHALQASGGGDVVVSGDAPVLLKDGTILINGQAESRIGAFLASSAISEGVGPSAAAGILPDHAEDAVLHQGVIIPSNVDVGAEMVEITRAARAAETGARIFQIYDDLIARVASKLGEVGR